MGSPRSVIAQSSRCGNQASRMTRVQGKASEPAGTVFICKAYKLEASDLCANAFMLAASTVPRERMNGWTPPQVWLGEHVDRAPHARGVPLRRVGALRLGPSRQEKHSPIMHIRFPARMWWRGRVGPAACKISEASQPGRKTSVTSLAPARAPL